jgi:hypothetical protein
VQVRDRAAAERDLSNFASDLALVFEPVHMVDFNVIASVPQPVYAMMRFDHPLAQKKEIRLRECLTYPHVLPAAEYGVRHLLEPATKVRYTELKPIAESDSAWMRRPGSITTAPATTARASDAFCRPTRSAMATGRQCTGSRWVDGCTDP